MRLFKFFWVLHRWFAGVFGVALICVAVTGLVLQFKGRSEWIQPETHSGAEGGAAEFITIERLLEVVWAQEHPGFEQLADVSRIDLRPDKRVYKVLSEHGQAELQVCAVTGSVLNVSWRPSDLVESIHDGSFFGGWVYDWVMPATAIGLVFLCLSGFWIWIQPKVRKRRARRRRAEAARASPAEA
jgi:uncharacterized iron-regulated membrane protein